MVTKYNLELEIVLVPHWWRTKPKITYGIDTKTINELELSGQYKIKFNDVLDIGQHTFWINFHNKDYADCILEKNLDMAVEIAEVKFESLSLDRFKWSGEYYPDYPLDYPNKQSVIKSATYLGWNERWQLSFTTPIFTWIHQLENLGWLYEP